MFDRNLNAPHQRNRLGRTGQCAVIPRFVFRNPSVPRLAPQASGTRLAGNESETVCRRCDLGVAPMAPARRHANFVRRAQRRLCRNERRAGRARARRLGKNDRRSDQSVDVNEDNSEPTQSRPFTGSRACDGRSIHGFLCQLGCVRARFVLARCESGTGRPPRQAGGG